MKVLITCFDPFGGGTTNSSMEVMALLPESIDNIQIIKEQLPTVYDRSVERMRGLIAKHQPDAIVMLGQAEGRTELSVERIGINLDEASLPDNEGVLRTGQSIVEGAPDGYFSTLPIKTMVETCKQSGIPAAISPSAGTFVCNHILFSTLHMLKLQNLDIPAGFVHIPATPAQAAAKRGASMDSRIAAEGLISMLRALWADLTTRKNERSCHNP